MHGNSRSFVGICDIDLRYVATPWVWTKSTWFVKYWCLVSHLISHGQILLKFCWSNHFEASGNLIELLFLDTTHSRLFITHTLAFRILDCSLLCLIDKFTQSNILVVFCNILITYPSIIQVVKLVIILHGIFFVSPRDYTFHGWIINNHLDIIWLFLFRLSDALLTIEDSCSLLLMSSILLYRCQRVIELQSSKHRLDQILESMSASHIIRFWDILRSAYVLLISPGCIRSTFKTSRWYAWCCCSCLLLFSI